MKKGHFFQNWCSYNQERATDRVEKLQKLKWTNLSKQLVLAKQVTGLLQVPTQRCARWPMQIFAFSSVECTLHRQESLEDGVAAELPAQHAEPFAISRCTSLVWQSYSTNLLNAFRERGSSAVASHSHGNRSQPRSTGCTLQRSTRILKHSPLCAYLRR